MFSSVFTEGLEISLFSIFIVFLLLSIVTLAISLLKHITVKEKTQAKKEEKTITKPISLSDIKDEDMMVAALVASIDYYNEMKKDVRVVSIKEIS
jgi:Na+-transporting methylmalonyl-CoA/oxaloacetate decarboxylase gamma subunit